MTVKPFLIITLLCSSSLLNTHPAHAQGIVTYDNAPIPSDSSPYNNGNGMQIGSIDQNGRINNTNGMQIGHTPNRALGALMLLNVIPLQ